MREHEETTYFDDLIYHTLNNLVSCNLSEKYLFEFAQQTHPTMSLTVGMIKRFQQYILEFGTEEQKKVWKNITTDERKKTEISIEESEDGFVIVTVDEEEKRIPVPNRQHDMEELPEPKWMEEEGFQYIFDNKQHNKVAELAGRYFAQAANQRYFAATVKTWLLKNAERTINDPDCFKAAYSETANFFIAKDGVISDASDSVRFVNAKAQFQALAQKLSLVYFEQDAPVSLFEQAVLDVAFSSIVKIENQANRIKKELLDADWKKSDVDDAVESYLEKVYANVVAEKNVSTDFITSALLEAERDLLIETYANQITEKNVPKQFKEYRELFIKLAKQSSQINDSASWDAGIALAAKVLNLIRVLDVEKKRVHTHTACKSNAVAKEQGFADAMTELGNINTPEKFEQIKTDLLGAKSELVKKRGWFSFFPCTQSTTEKNLRKFINNEAPERNVIKIRQ